MKIISCEGQKYELKIETLDDLWVLSQFIVSGDVIFGKTLRKVKIGGESSTKQVKKVIYIELEVKKVDFDGSCLKVSGFILNETEFTAIGQSQTINFGISDVVEIKKKVLLEYEKELLKNAVDDKKSLNLLVLVDKEDLIVAQFSDFSYKILLKKSGLGSKKRYSNQKIDDTAEKFGLIEPFFKKNYSSFIIAGPGFFKENLAKYIKSKVSDVDVVLFQFSDVVEGSVLKVIREINSSEIVLNSKLKVEGEVISNLLENISKGVKYSYGREVVLNSIDEGKVEKLLVSTKFIEEEKENDTYAELNEKFVLVEKLKGKLFILDSKNEAGKILDGLGGIASINRF